MSNLIVVIDFGSQYSQLIARRIREMNVYSELLPWDAAYEKKHQLKTQGIYPLRRTGIGVSRRSTAAAGVSSWNPVYPSWEFATAYRRLPIPWGAW